MTDSEFRAWLNEGGRYTILVEVSTDVPKYLSTVAYATNPTNTAETVQYTPVVSDGVSFKEALSLSGGANLSVGDIQLSNADGLLDSWLSEVWVNRSINIYVGDATWARQDFRRIFSGVVAELDSASAGVLNIVVRDKLQRLNTPVSEVLLGGASTNKDRYVPITIGECHNVTPLLVDPATHEYQFHVGGAESLIEVRDNGVPVVVDKNLSAGKFKHTQTPVGTITCSVQGQTPYVATVAGVVRTLATVYGAPSERFTESDLDLPQLASFELGHPQHVGIYIDNRANVLAVCQEVAESVGAQVTMSREGKLRLVKISQPIAASMTISESDYEAGTLEIQERTTVAAGVKLGYAKNWTVQETLDTGIPPEHKDLFAQEWLTVSERSSEVAASHRLYAEPSQENTLLLSTSDAQAECTRRLNLVKTQRTVYRCKGYAHLLLLELGQFVILKSKRFGLSDGKVGQIVGLDSDWVGRRVAVEVLI